MRFGAREVQSNEFLRGCGSGEIIGWNSALARPTHNIPAATHSSSLVLLFLVLTQLRASGNEKFIFHHVLGQCYETLSHKKVISSGEMSTLVLMRLVLDWIPTFLSLYL